ncbi:hypothetical protein [Streptomyces sp. NPDC020681]|uniref:hypothetical protein n=1 Tax=Streptomyces sp. NPDC020681 TaxID=3365083 RepID=UPI00379C99DD
MELTQLPATLRPESEPPSDGESEQAEHAFNDAIGSPAPHMGARRYHAPIRALNAARPLFELGWLTAVRNGHTGPALAGVALPGAMAEEAFGGLARAMAPRDVAAGLLLEQRVSYHGSLTSRHGRYWVTAIAETVERDGTGQDCRYELSVWTGSRYRVVVTNVRGQSITPLPHFRGRGSEE